MTLTEEEIKAIEREAEEVYPFHSHPDEYHYPNVAITELQRKAFSYGKQQERIKAKALIEALETIAYGYDNKSNRPGVHIGYAGAKDIAEKAINQYNNKTV